MYLGGRALALPPQQKNIFCTKGKIQIGACALGGDEDEPGAGVGLHERLPGGMAHDLGALQIVHAGAAKFLVAEQEAAGLDDVHTDAQTGAQPDQGTGVLGDIGLVEGEAHKLPSKRLTCS